jgi:hypothetical protein
MIHQRFGRQSAFIRAPILTKAVPLTQRMLDATCDTRRLENMGFIGVYQPIFCWWGCVIIAEIGWVRSRSRNATKHHRKIAATIRLVSTSVKGPRSIVIEANSIIFVQFILGDTTINLGWQKVSQNVVFWPQKSATNRHMSPHQQSILIGCITGRVYTTIQAIIDTFIGRGSGQNCQQRREFTKRQWLFQRPLPLR